MFRIDLPTFEGRYFFVSDMTREPGNDEFRNTESDVADPSLQVCANSLVPMRVFYESSRLWSANQSARIR